jgi:hypothetical protein
MSKESEELTAFREEMIREINEKKKITRREEIHKKACLTYKYLEDAAEEAKNMWLSKGDNRWDEDALYLKKKWVYLSEKYNDAVKEYINLMA